jgi:hypothetical protein
VGKKIEELVTYLLLKIPFFVARVLNANLVFSQHAAFVPHLLHPEQAPRLGKVSAMGMACIGGLIFSLSFARRSGRQ